MKILNNMCLVTSSYMSKFERFWICNNQEKMIFLRGPKTFGSPFIMEQKTSYGSKFKRQSRSKFCIHRTEPEIVL
jgi:hypothetical protein